jgi:hypothetical protein
LKVLTSLLLGKWVRFSIARIIVLKEPVKASGARNIRELSPLVAGRFRIIENITNKGRGSNDATGKRKKSL